MIVDDNTPPIEHAIENLSPGQFVQQLITFSESDVESFGQLTADYAAAHFD